jgi:hypothetical protein
MPLMNSYLTSTKDLESFLNAIVTAQAPEQFTTAFLRNLDFSSSNHRLFIGMLRGLGFLDESGAPTQRYYDYLDQTQSRVVLAQAIREAYGDLFAINKNAHEMTYEEVKNKLRTLTQGKKSDDVISKMATTFVALNTSAGFTNACGHFPSRRQAPEGSAASRRAEDSIALQHSDSSSGVTRPASVRLDLPCPPRASDMRCLND